MLVQFVQVLLDTAPYPYAILKYKKDIFNTVHLSYLIPTITVHECLTGTEQIGQTNEKFISHSSLPFKF
jgi:hypothetical protein